MKLNSITIRRPFERHIHFRDGDMLKTVLPCTLRQRFTGAIVMPNLFKPGGIPNPVDSIEKALAYRERINAVRSDYFMSRVPFIGNGEDQFEPCMTLYLTDHTTPEEVVEGYKRGAWRAVKLYIADRNGEGGTTGSAHGVRDLLGRYKVFEAMEKHNIPLLGHWEAAEEDIDEFDREIVSVDRDLKPVLRSFPGMPVVFEHITTGDAADVVADYEHPGGLYATVTVQHLVINRNAMFWKPGKGRAMMPINYCLPVPKSEENRWRVRKHVTSGNRRFGAGTDSAPHDESAKSQCCGCAAGIFTGDSAIERYATIFDEDNMVEHFNPFMSENFLHIYGMKASWEMITLERTPMTIPEKIGSVKVFQGGRTLPWSIVG